MCWSTEASLGLAGAGFGVAIYAHRKGLPKGMTIPLAYFSLMELLQGLTYPTLDQCSSPSNQIFTILGYYHIAFQAFFINMLMLEFVPKWLKEKVQLSVYVFCGVVASVFLLSAYPFAWAVKCDIALNTPLCGEILCARTGSWHLAWDVPLNFFQLFQSEASPFSRWDAMQIAYCTGSLILPLLYGSWRVTLFMFIFGPFLADLFTTNNNEWAAIWCLFSIIFISIALWKPLRERMVVNNYYGWHPKGR